MNGYIAQRRLAIGIVAILLLLACASAAVAAPEQLIPGKVFVLKANKSGGVKLIFKTKADMTFGWYPCANDPLNNNEEVQILLERPDSSIYETTIPVDTMTCRLTNSFEVGSFDDGRCKIKWRVGINLDISSIKIKCVIPEFAFSPVVGASFIFHQDSIDPASMGACFADPVLGLPNSAVVKKDGSDGKTFKMTDAPLAACEGF